MLGWARATRLTLAQQEILEQSDYMTGDAHYHRNFDLLTSVSQALERLETKTKMCRNVSQPTSGSIVHSMSQELEELPTGTPFNCDFQYTDYGDLVGYSEVHHTPSSWTAGVTFKFRVLARDDKFNPWCCYDFNDYTQSHKLGGLCLTESFKLTNLF